MVCSDSPSLLIECPKIAQAWPWNLGLSTISEKVSATDVTQTYFPSQLGSMHQNIQKVTKAHLCYSYKCFAKDETHWDPHRRPGAATCCPNRNSVESGRRRSNVRVTSVAKIEAGKTGPPPGETLPKAPSLVLDWRREPPSSLSSASSRTWRTWYRSGGEESTKTWVFFRNS